MRHGRHDYNQRIQDDEDLIPADEPVFLIRAQDRVGHTVVRLWADLHEAFGGDPEISRRARDHADLMENWPSKKSADH